MQQKIKLILIIGFCFFLNPKIQAQSQSLDRDRFYIELRKIVSKTAVLNPFDSTERKFISFSYEVLIGKDVKVQISDHAPWGAKNRTKNLEADIVKLLKDQQMGTDDEVTIVYPIFFQFEHITETSNSMGHAIESLIDYSSQTKCAKIERPIYVQAKKSIVN